MTERLSSNMRLASEPGRWQVVLKAGVTIHLLAHSYSINGDDCVFSLLIDGMPAYEVEVVRLPGSIVASVEGG